MRFYKKVIFVALLGILIPLKGLVAQEPAFEVAKSFYPDVESLQKEDIIWGFLTVPENWEDPNNSNKVKVAVAILKNKKDKPNAEAVVFVQGGPGASGIRTIWTWRNHPLRQQNDIILFDVRGTGFSKPRLCPDLGKQFLKILAKNQSAAEDEKQKVSAAISCQKKLLNEGVDINAYHSLSVAKDLNALKSQLGYPSWNVYSVSYGTYIAQVYANAYPDDIQSLILDSPIDNIATYYTRNTSNYISSLSKVFKECQNDNECNQEYPNLEAVYYQVIDELENSPITVSVGKDIIESGEFTYNSEDFKVAIQQALYHKQLVEIIPLLIYQFRARNESALGNLVPAFANLLHMDYGVYFCMSCKEALPNNDIKEYFEDAAQFEPLKGGLSFYKTDFNVCESWNLSGSNLPAKQHDMSNLGSLPFPVIIFSGGYDPITPMVNGERASKTFKNAFLITAESYGHTPSFSRVGYKVTEAFISNPLYSPDMKAFEETSKVYFVKNVKINRGISEMGNSLNQPDPLFLLPLGIALIVIIAFVFIYSARLLIGKYSSAADKIIRGFSVLTSFFGLGILAGFVLALLKVADQNYFVLAFGLPASFDYLFTCVVVFILLLMLTVIYFLVKVKKISNRSVLFSVIFSNFLISTYLLYWGIL